MSYNLDSGAAGTAVADETLITYTHAIYALHALSVLIGITTAVTVVASFVMGIPSIVAVIMNYARRRATYGTFLESHFRWQIRTFWFALLWSIIIWAICFPLFFVLIGFPLFWASFAALELWIIYRVARGWLALRDRRPMYI
jgi:uncharacterized membrane protein